MIARCQSDTACPDLSNEDMSAEALNRECRCLTLDSERLETQLRMTVDSDEIYDLIRQRYSSLFSSVPVFAGRNFADGMAAIIGAIQDTVTRLQYRARVLGEAPEIARFDPGAVGVFMGYDFHLGQEGPKLIEINTNAGGGLLNVVLAKAQKNCCAPTNAMHTEPLPLDTMEDALVEMFIEEYRLAMPGAPLRTIAIVDDEPASQFLYPEFLLFRFLFLRHGIDAVIADPRELEMRDGGLWHREKRIDLVYNRLTDFYFTEDAHATLRRAYVERAAVITPHPHAHALYANKRNLMLLSDAEALASIGVPAATARILLNGIPSTCAVKAENADMLWQDRRRLFFKPAEGFGSKAAYRGDKLTRRVWEEILRGDYVAQSLVPPSERTVRAAYTGEELSTLKLDVRCYVYRDRVQLTAARLYQGQTTNFRTEGGGFAPVFVLDESRGCCT